MEFEYFSTANLGAARDFLYLAAIFSGAGMGCLLYRLRRKTPTRFKNLSVSLCFFFLAAALAALTAALIISNWEIFAHNEIYLPMGIFAALLMLAVRFPKAAGFPVLLGSGIVILWIGLTFLRFPAVTEFTLAQINREESGLVRIVPLPQSAAAPYYPVPFRPIGENFELELRTQLLLPSKIIPFAGGTWRALHLEILDNHKLLYQFGNARNPNERGPFASRFSSFLESQKTIDTRQIFHGTSLTVYIEGK